MLFIRSDGSQITPSASETQLSVVSFRRNHDTHVPSTGCASDTCEMKSTTDAHNDDSSDQINPQKMSSPRAEARAQKDLAKTLNILTNPTISLTARHNRHCRDDSNRWHSAGFEENTCRLFSPYVSHRGDFTDMITQLQGGEVRITVDCGHFGRSQINRADLVQVSRWSWLWRKNMSVYGESSYSCNDTGLSH